jgi:hypothetical protein
MANTKPPVAGSPQKLLELADLYEGRGEPKMRDRFLILAADAAFGAGQTDEAERLMRRLLQVSPHHLLKAYPTFAEALQAEPVRTYLNDLRANYSAPMVETLLQTLRGQNTVRMGAGDGLVLPPEKAEEETLLLPLEAPAKPAPVRPKKAAALPLPAAEPQVLKPLPAPPPGPPARQARPATPAVTYPVAQPPPPRKKARKNKGGPGGGWFALLLFVLLLLVGLALALYSLARPFLPAGWLP